MSLWNVFLIPGTYVEEVLLMPFQDEVLNVYNGPPEKLSCVGGPVPTI